MQAYLPHLEEIPLVYLSRLDFGLAQESVSLMLVVLKFRHPFDFIRHHDREVCFEKA